MTYFWFLAGDLFWEILCWDGIFAQNGWDHLMHVKEVSGKRDPKPYPFKQGEKAHGRTKRIGTYHGMGSGRKKMY